MVFPKLKKTKYRYGGMQFEGVSEFGSQDGATITIASARDIGNVGAGFVAGRARLSWGVARLGFDALESWQKGKPAQEATPTRRAQVKGFNAGTTVFDREKIQRTINESKGCHLIKFRKMKKRILISLLTIALIISGFLITYHQSRSYYCLNEDRCITVWKRLGNECYIIPGKYKDIAAPEDNYIRTSNVNDATIYWSDQLPHQIIIRIASDYYLKNGDTSNQKIVDYNDTNKNDELRSVIYGDGKKRFNELKNDAYYIAIDIRYNKARDKNGNKLKGK